MKYRIITISETNKTYYYDVVRNIWQPWKTFDQLLTPEQTILALEKIEKNEGFERLKVQKVEFHQDFQTPSDILVQLKKEAEQNAPLSVSPTCNASQNGL